MSDSVVRIRVNADALRRAFPPPEPSRIGERLREAGASGAPIFEAAFRLAFAGINRLRR